MPTPTNHLNVAFVYPEPGEKTPRIALMQPDGVIVASASTREPLPELPVPDASAGRITALDVLEHVHDEQAWLGELNRILAPGGELTVRVPLENWMAWADALNISRYAADTLGIGEEPADTIPTGWHRHYAPSDIPDLMRLAGFEVISVSTQGTPIMEVPQLAALLIGNARKDHSPQRRIGQWLDSRRNAPRLPLPSKVAATITVQGTKVRDGYEPDPHLTRADRPEFQSDEPLE